MGPDVDDSSLLVGHWWTGSGDSGEPDETSPFRRTTASGVRRLMPPFDISIVRDKFAPWLLKNYQRADLTQYEYAINGVFAREDRRFVKGGRGDPPWAGADFDLINTRYTSLRATYNDEDGVETNVGGANRVKESTVQWMLEKAEAQRSELENSALGEFAASTKLNSFGDTMAVLTGVTLMARSNSSGGIRGTDIIPHPTDGSLLINVRVWARKGTKKQRRSKADSRTVPMRIPAGKDSAEGGRHPRNRYIALMRYLKTTYDRGGGLPRFPPDSSARRMTALIKRVLGGTKASKAFMYDTSTSPSSHTLRKTGATMAERAGAPRHGRFLRWGGWDEPKALVNYVSGEWEATGFSHRYFDWLVDYSI